LQRWGAAIAMATFSFPVVVCALASTAVILSGCGSSGKPEPKAAVVFDYSFGAN